MASGWWLRSLWYCSPARDDAGIVSPSRLSAVSPYGPRFGQSPSGCSWNTKHDDSSWTWSAACRNACCHSKSGCRPYSGSFGHWQGLNYLLPLAKGIVLYTAQACYSAFSLIPCNRQGGHSTFCYRWIGHSRRSWQTSFSVPLSGIFCIGMPYSLSSPALTFQILSLLPLIILQINLWSHCFSDGIEPSEKPAIHLAA